MITTAAKLVCQAAVRRGVVWTKGPARSRRSRFKAYLGALGLSAILALVQLSVCSVAQASTPIFNFTASPSTTQAGGHPDIFTGWTVGDHSTVDKLGGCDCSDAKNFIVNNPTGVIGNPHATPQCTEVDFATDSCPVDTQVGVAAVNAVFKWLVPIFNLEPTPNNVGLIGFNVPLAHLPIYEIINPRTESDYGLRFSVLGIPVHSFTPTTEVYQRIWGVPADPIHNALRFPFKENVCFSSLHASEVIEWTNFLEPHECGFRNYTTAGIASNAEQIPFISNPTTCGVPLTASLEVDSYDDGVEQAQVPWPATTGCDQLSFNPSLFAEPTTSSSDSPSGIQVNLHVPQQVSPSVPSPSEIRTATITLPPGFTINPNAADGKTSCSDLAAKFGTEEEAQCPEDSKVGSLTIESSALPGPLPGYVYLGEPRARKPLPRIPCCKRIRSSHQDCRNRDTRSTDGATDYQFRQSSAISVLRLQHALLRFRTGAFGHANCLRHLPGHFYLHPMGFPAFRANLHPVLHAQLRSRWSSVSAQPSAI